MLTDILVYFAHAAVVVFGALTALWVISVAAKDASLVDIFWGFGFLLVGAVCLYLVPVKTPGVCASRSILENGTSVTVRTNATRRCANGLKKRA